MLNPQQQAAVECLEGPLLVLAGAGSGKTRVVTRRIVHLIESGVHPSQILGLTFTNKAAGEMRERVQKLSQQNVLICTFHSLGARILRESGTHLGLTNGFTIYDDSDVDKLLKVCLEDLAIPDKEAKAVMGKISKAKNNLQLPDEVEGSDAADPFPQAYREYQKKLRDCNAVDFDDLLLLPVRLFREHPAVLTQYQNRFRYLLIDEYQDTNEAQYTMTKLLVAKSRNLCVVGDPDQSIYSWRGANISNILNFEEDFPGAKVVRLEQNYRSSSNILEAANDLIGYNTGRYKKHLWSDLGPGEKVKQRTLDNERLEAAFAAERIREHHEKKQIPLREMVIFYRTNAQSRPFEDRFLLNRIPYVVVGGVSFYQRREIKDILAYMRMVHSGSDIISFTRTINLPKRGIGGTTINKIRSGADQEGISILKYCEALIDGEPLESPLRLTAKQREGLTDYVKVIRELRHIYGEGTLDELVRATIRQSGYLAFLKEDQETFHDRKENLDQLVAKAIEWQRASETPTLNAFLEELSLKSSLDEAEGSADRVNLMTIHNGKGLEFRVVIVAGLEEDLFPHANSRGNNDAVEEERRLCYVGMTRAKEYLYLTNVRQRFLWGTDRAQRPSRFLMEIPTKYIEKLGVSHYPQKKVNDDVFIDDVDQTGENSLSPGETVFHPTFGIGVIRDSQQGSAGLVYKVFFSRDNTEKTIAAKYSPLTKL